MKTAPLAALLVLWLSGCTAAPADLDAGTHAPPSSAHAETFDLEDWNGGLAIGATLTAPAETACALDMTITYSQGVDWPDFFLEYFDVQHRIHGRGGYYLDDTAHAKGIVDSRKITRDLPVLYKPPRDATRTDSLQLDVDPTPRHLRLVVPEARDLRLSLECDTNVQVSNRTAGRDVVAFTAHTLRGDYGVAVSMGGAIRGATVQHTFTSEAVGFGLWHGKELSTIVLRHPAGTREWTNTPEAYMAKPPLTPIQIHVRRHDGGPGPYSLEIDRTAAGTSSLAGYFAGLHTVKDWADVRRLAPSA